MGDCVWRRKGSDDGAILAAVATIIDDFWDVCPNRVANREEDDVAGCEPGDHKEGEDVVADGFESEVFEAFGDLALISFWLTQVER